MAVMLFAKLISTEEKLQDLDIDNVFYCCIEVIKSELG